MDPTLERSLKLKVMAQYQTSNPKCKVTINTLEGVASNRQLTETSSIPINIKGYGKLAFPLNKYSKQSFCQWQLISLSWAIEPTNTEIDIGFFNLDKPDKAKAHMKANLICNKNSCSGDVGSFYLGSSQSLPTKQNYYFDINIKKEK